MPPPSPLPSLSSASNLPTSPSSSRHLSSAPHAHQPPAQKRPRQRAPQLSGGWLADLPSAGGRGRGCGHFVWGEPEAREKVAAFDLDGTVIRPLDGRSFPQNAADWEWCGPTVTRKLRDTYKAGYSILLISNQASPVPKLATDFRRKLPVVCRKLNVPLHAFAAWEFDEHRKSATGMWDEYVRVNEAKGVEIDYPQSFYVGDAAGRPIDHADTDRKFAFNTSLPFLTPEQFFDGAEADGNWAMWGWNPLEWDHTAPDPPPLVSTSSPTPAAALGDYDGPEVVLLVGAPAVGKTTWFERELEGKGLERKSFASPKAPVELLDALKFRLDAFYASLDSAASLIPSAAPSSPSGSSSSHLSAPLNPPSTSAQPPDPPAPSSPPPPPKIALEASLPSRFSRRSLLNFLRHYSPPASSAAPTDSPSTPSPASPSPPPVRVSCVLFAAPVELGKHNSIFRAGESKRAAAGKGKGEGDGKGVQVVDVKEFQRWEREWEEPTLAEGFHSIHPVHFRFSSDDPGALQRWNRFLLDVYPGKQWKTGRLAVKGPTFGVAV
ncbi:hypothetical protein JCM6882_008921 [Rhodosporidiobolus microsporus]